MYATLQDLIDILGESTLLRIADRDRDDQIDAPVVAEALLDASAEIDSYVSKRYKLPMKSVPRRLRRIAVDLAHYGLDQDPSDDLRKRYEDAKRALKDISMGVATLEDAELSETGDTPDEGGPSASEPALSQFESSLDMGGYS